jgi:hypothetical protein
VATCWDKEYGQRLDAYLFLLFGLLFLLLQCVLAAWLHLAYGKKRRIKAEEARFLDLFKVKEKKSPLFVLTSFIL